MPFAVAGQTVAVDPKNTNNVLVTGKCVITGEPYSLSVDGLAFNRWKCGEYIQVAFPNLSADDRELLMTGTSAEGWRRMFGDE